MVKIQYGDQLVEVENGQTILEVLLHEGHEIPNNCRAGACQSCLMQAIDGEVPAAAQSGLKDTQKSQGYFMACRCQPSSDLKISPLNAEEIFTTATVIERQLLSEDVLRLRLVPEKPFAYRAGQFVTLWNSQKIGRSYSLASVFGVDPFLEFHIRRIDEGRLSPWLHEQIDINDQLQIQPACGDCFYVPENKLQPILLAGTSTGLAPLIGIARDALEQSHEGEIHLLHGALKPAGLYLHNTLLSMAQAYDNFHYHASVLENDHSIAGIGEGSLDEQAMGLLSNPAEWKIYLCGAPEMVNSLKKKIFLAGANMRNIHSDPFIPASKDNQ